MDLTELRDFITKYFNDSELRDLCFDLGVEYENLGGDNKAAKARELVAYCQRHGRMTQLEETCRRLRPNAALECLFNAGFLRAGMPPRLMDVVFFAGSPGFDRRS